MKLLKLFELLISRKSYRKSHKTKSKNLANPRLALDNQAQMDNVLIKSENVWKKIGDEKAYTCILQGTQFI